MLFKLYVCVHVHIFFIQKTVMCFKFKSPAITNKREKTCDLTILINAKIQ